MTGPRTHLRPETAGSGRNSQRAGYLTVLPGGRNRPAMATVPLADLDEMHIDLVAARAERTVYAAKMRDLIRVVARRIATAHYAAAGTSLLEMDRLTSQERDRARSMDAATCPCGCEGSGHGPADEDVLAVPDEVAA